MQEISELRSLIARVRRRWFGLIALRTIARAAFAAAVPILAAVVVHRLLAPRGVALILVAAFTLLAVAAAVTMVLRRMQRRPDDRQVARFVEERTAADGTRPPFDDALVSAVEMSEASGSADRGFAALVVGQAVARLRQLDGASLISPADLRRASVECLAGVGTLGLIVWAALPGLRLAADTAWVHLFPQSLVVAVAPGDARIVAGRPFTIHASLQGRGAGLHEFVPTLVVSAGGEERRVQMNAASGGFAFQFESVDRSFSYRVTAAAASSSTYSVTAVFPPRVRRIDVLYKYPSFTGLQDREDEDTGDVYGPAGTRVRVRIHTDKAVRSGELSLSGGRAVAAASAGDRAVDAQLVLSKDDSYRVRLADADGLRSIGDTEYFIRLMDDRPPEVRILRPSSDQGITPLEEVAIEARADDDYGIASFDLVYSVAGREERVARFRNVTGTTVAKSGSYLLAAEDLGVQPGDVITYYARARDIARGKRPTETRSDIFFLEVKPFSEEFVAAQSQAMAGAAGTQIDSLVAAQKEIINATWNLERRAIAGRSAEDVKAVADAQAELKARAERMAFRGRRRGGFLPQQQVRPPPRSSQRPRVDPVADAVDAMGRAVEQLEASRTKDAVAHEMAALQGLLKAQAEIRRRQVAQSASGASAGGSGRSGQDLSALFDRELQRQQRTNYETPEQAAHEREEDATSALDRIRDLARRQAELSRRQRELARAGLSQEELKRRLETLRREQMELRKELEGSASERGQGSELRDASDEMRRAASELERQDAGAAADRAERAAERLRQLEQQMRGQGMNAQQRSAGELRLEAQQIAEAQNRIAAEASRLDGNAPAGSGDALRRLAGAKETLADRVDELQRASEQLARQPSRPARQGDAANGGNSAQAAARAAAAALQRDRIARRMREAAKEMHAASEAGSTSGSRPGRAQTEEQLARDMERIVDALSGGSQDETRQLAERLDQTREIRERLNRLEGQVREAEGRKSAGNQGRASASGRGGRSGTPGGEQPGEVNRLREEYARELQRARQTLGRLQGEARSGLDMATPEQHEYSRSAPGTESFKQDFAGWESLRKDLDLALERYESAVSERLARRLDEDRLSAGGSERVPDGYRALIARYYESLAKIKK